MADITIGNLRFAAHIDIGDFRKSVGELQSSLNNLASTNKDQANAAAAASRAQATRIKQVIKLNDRFARSQQADSEAAKELNTALHELTFQLSKQEPDVKNLTQAHINFGLAVTKAELSTKKSGTTVGKYTTDLNKLSKASIRTENFVSRVGNALGNEQGSKGAPIIRQARLEYSKLDKALRNTTSQKKAAEATRVFDERMAGLGRRLRSGGGPTEGVSSFTIRLRNMTSAATLAVGPLSGIGARVTAFAAIAQRSTLALAGLITGITLGGLAIAKLGQIAVTVGKLLEDVRIRLKALAEHTYVNVIQFGKLQLLAYRTGQEFVALSKHFTLLTAAAKGTNVEGAATFKILEDLSFAAGKFKLSNDQVNGVLLAFTQILSKGRVQAEEITGQLSERLPGAFNIAARATGVTTAKFAEMLRKGEVISDEFLPKFAAELRRTYGATSRRPLENLTAAQNRLTNTFTRLGDNVGQQLQILDAWRASINGVNSITKLFSENLEVITRVSFAVVGAMAGLAGPLIFRGLFRLVAITKGLSKALKTLALLGVAANVTRLTTAFKALNIAMLANPAIFTAKAFQVLAIAAAGIIGGLAAADKAIADTTERQKELNIAITEFLNKDLAPSQANIDTTRLFISDLQKGLDTLDEQINAINKKPLLNEDYNATNPFGSLFATLTNRARASDREDYDALAKEIFTLSKRRARLFALIEKLTTTQAEEINAKGLIALDKVAARVEVLREKTRRLGLEQDALRYGASTEDIRSLQIQEKATERFVKTVTELSKVLGREDQQLIHAAARKEAIATADLERKKDSLNETRKAVGAVNSLIVAQEKEIKQLEQLAKFNDPNLTKAQNKALADAAAQITKNGFHLDTYVQKQQEIIANERTLKKLRAESLEDQRVLDAETGLRALNAKTAAITDQVNKQRILNIAVRNFENLDAAKAHYDIIKAVNEERKRLEGLKIGINETEAAITSFREEAEKAFEFDQEHTKIIEAYNNIRAAIKSTARELAVLRGINPADLAIGLDAAKQLAATQIDGAIAKIDPPLLAAIIAQMRKDLAEIAILNERYKPTDSTDKSGNAIRDAQLAIAKLNRELETSRAIQGRLQELRPFKDLENDLKIADEVASFVAKLEKAEVAQGIIDDLTGQFNGLLIAIKDSDVETAKLTKNMNNFSSIVDKINEDRNILSFFNATDIRFGEQTARTLADTAYKYSLLTEEQKAATQSLQEYRQAIINADIENKRVANIGAAYTATFGAIEGGIDTATKQFSDAVAQWDKELLKFKDLSQTIVSEIVNAFLQLAVIRPLIDNIFAGNGNGYLNNVGDSFKSIFSNRGVSDRVASAGGFSLSNIGGGSPTASPPVVRGLAKGGIINAPTTFGTSEGLTQAGERGAEAILPLMRDSSGNLGVASSGSKQPIIINFNFAPGTDESGFRRSQSQIEAGVRQAVERGARNG